MHQCFSVDLCFFPRTFYLDKKHVISIFRCEISLPVFAPSPVPSSVLPSGFWTSHSPSFSTSVPFLVFRFPVSGTRPPPTAFSVTIWVGLLVLSLLFLLSSLFLFSLSLILRGVVFYISQRFWCTTLQEQPLSVRVHLFQVLWKLVSLRDGKSLLVYNYS